MVHEGKPTPAVKYTGQVEDRYCFNCRYSAAAAMDDEGSVVLECHFLPPTILLDPDGDLARVFPPVAMSDWCSQWTAEHKTAKIES